MMMRSRKAGRGILMILALFLASAGALRFGQGVGAAMALSNEEQVPDVVDAAVPAICPAPPLALAEALSAREVALVAQEISLADRLAALALADEAITLRLAELQTAEAELKATLQIADGAAEDDLARLTAVYEAMKPVDAAAVFEKMAPEFAAGFLGRMRAESAANVLAGMKPEMAYEISVLIAGRNALAPKE